MPLRGMTVRGVLYLSCSDGCNEGHVEIAGSQDGDRMEWLLHREGEVLWGTAFDVNAHAPVVAAIRAVLPQLPTAPIAALSEDTTEALAPIAPLLSA